MSASSAIGLRFTGDYSLAASVRLAQQAAFVSPSDDPGRLDLAFPLEGSWRPVAVRVVEDDAGLRAHIVADPDGAPRDAVRSQLERILSLGVDGAGFQEVGRGDAVVGRLQARSPGVRPVLFASPYEAAARAIIGHRIPVRHAAAVHRRLSADQGAVLVTDEGPVYAFPSPERLAGLAPVDGLAGRKVDQLRALGAAASKGALDSGRLRAMEPAAAMAELQQLPGIGPFSAELIMIRGVGDPDAFPNQELRLQRAMAIAYGLGVEPPVETLEAIAERWRPYRSWVGLLLRNADLAAP